MKFNKFVSVFTHNGAKAVVTDPFTGLQRTVLSCLLFEDTFYEDGITAIDRIKELCTQVSCENIMDLACLAAHNYKLRHVPLQLIVEALKHKNKPKDMAFVISGILTRPDMMTDLLALYWKDGKKCIPYQMNRALKLAFTKWDEYQLAKYNRDDPVKLRDVLFMCHAKPESEKQAEVWKRLVEGTLKTPDTWETRLSAGEDKKESFEDLLKSGKMGKLAILRNMRNMFDAGISKDLVGTELYRNMKEMLPFQYIAAAREVPQWEDLVDASMIHACSLKPKMDGKTIILVDVSGSMSYPISSKSKMTRMDAACGLAILLRECCPDSWVYTFSDGFKPVPPRRGMALRDAIIRSQNHSNTYLGNALQHIYHSDEKYDRLVVITDEQSNDAIPRMAMGKNYILNIAPYQNGVGSKDEWFTINGFSEASIDFIRELEKLESVS